MLSYNDKKVTLEIDQIIQEYDADLIDKKFKNFQTIFITQKLLRLKDGSYLIYENAPTDFNYQFEPSTVRTLSIIFEAKQLVKVYSKNFLNFYQIRLKDNRVLNVISQHSDDQRLTLLYGMSTKHFNHLIAQFDKNAPKATTHKVVKIDQLNSEKYTKWDVRKIHFAPLVTPLRMLMGGL